MNLCSLHCCKAMNVCSKETHFSMSKLPCPSAVLCSNSGLKLAHVLPTMAFWLSFSDEAASMDAPLPFPEPVAHENADAGMSDKEVESMAETQLADDVDDEAVTEKPRARSAYKSKVPNDQRKPRSADKFPRKKRGSAGTFAGRRPPKDPDLFTAFQEMKDSFHEEKLQKVQKKQCKERNVSSSVYMTFMKEEMKKNGGSVSEAIKSWKQALQPPDWGLDAGSC